MAMAQDSYSKCSTCNKDIGHLYCYNCQKVLCGSCKPFHDKFVKGHIVTSSKNVDKVVVNAEITCPIHEKELSYYCLFSACNRLICDQCVIGDHRTHARETVSKNAKRTRQQLKEKATEYEMASTTLSKLIQEGETNQLPSLIRQMSSYSKQANEASDKLVEIISIIKDASLRSADDSISLEQQRIHSKLSDLKELKETIDAKSKKITYILTVEYDTTFLVLQKALSNVKLDMSDTTLGITSTSVLGSFPTTEFINAVVEKIHISSPVRCIDDNVKEIEGLKTTVQKLERTLQCYQEEVEEYCIRVDQLREEQVTSVMESTQVIQDQQKKILEKDGTILDMKQEIDAVYERMSSVEGRLNQTNMELTEKNEQVKHQREQIKEKDHQMQTLKEEILEFQENIFQMSYARTLINEKESGICIAAGIHISRESAGVGFIHRSNYKTDKTVVKTLTLKSGREKYSPLVRNFVLYNCITEHVDIGYDAKVQYNELKNSNPADIDCCYLFQNFEILDKKDLLEDAKVTDICGKELPAIKVISMLIRGMKDKLLSSVNGGSIGKLLRWTITGPAFWDNRTRNFILKAAEMAGIEQSKMTLKIEPEAVFTYCKNWWTKNTFKDVKSSIFSGKSKHLIVELGSESMKISIITEDMTRSMRTIQSVCSDPTGTDTIIEAFNDILVECFGKACVDTFCETFSNEADDLYTQVENRLQHLNNNADKVMRIRIPVSLFDVYDKECGSSLSENIRKAAMSRYRPMQYDADEVRSLFDRICKALDAQMKNVKEKYAFSDLNSIMVVGKFANCSPIRSKVTETFPDREIIIPSDPEVASLIGTILSGFSDKCLF